MRIFGQTVSIGGPARSYRAGIVSDGSIVDIYTRAQGEAGLVDLETTTAMYEEDENCYGPGIVATEQLYESVDAITSLLVDELTNTPIGTRGTVDVSFDNGNSWAVGFAMGSTLTDFSGTSSDGGVYKLKLKFNLGSDYGTDVYVWTTTSALNEAKADFAGCGLTSAALCFGGYDTSAAIVSTTEKWSEGSWVTTSSLTNAIQALGGCGTVSSALSFAGHTGATVNHTNKWNGSTWATTTNLSEAKHTPAGCGTTSGALCFGGYITSAVNTTELWSGGSWSTTSSLTQSKRSLAGGGNADAALAWGGDTASGAYVTVTEIWNSLTWATTSSLIEGQQEMAGCGTTSAALTFGGADADYRDGVEIWSGSSWATTTSLNEAKYYNEGCGISTSALCFGGDSGSVVSTTEKWGHSGVQLGFAVNIN